MNETKPTPWEARGRDIWHGQRSVGEVGNADYAELIVRAVNAHEELVAALKSAQPHLCSNLCPSVKRTGEDWTHSHECVAVTAALSKAGSR